MGGLVPGDTEDSAPFGDHEFRVTARGSGHKGGRVLAYEALVTQMLYFSIGCRRLRYALRIKNVPIIT